mgnify:CR=1 FL=1
MKKKLTIDEQIEDLKKKGVTFENLMNIPYFYNRVLKTGINEHIKIKHITNL